MDPTVNPSQYPPAQPQYQQPQQQPPFPQQPYQPPFPPQSYQPHQAAPTATADSAGWRRWLSGALGIAGGSIVLSVVEGQLPYSLSGVSGGSAAIVVLLMAQLLFGVAVVVVAYLGAPGPVASRAIGIGLFVVAVIAATALVQVIVHLRYFLHLDLATSPRENILALCFAALLIVIMVGGSMWIMLDLHQRMMP